MNEYTKGPWFAPRLRQLFKTIGKTTYLCSNKNMISGLSRRLSQVSMNLSIGKFRRIRLSVNPRRQVSVNLRRQVSMNRIFGESIFGESEATSFGESDFR
jgi:hypothetical protein